MRSAFRAAAALVLAFGLHGETLHGLYWNIPTPDSEDEARKDLAVLQSNPYLTGVYIGARWNELEPEQEKYDFSALDRGIAAVRAADKQYKLVIVPGASTPAYVYADGAARFPTKVVNPHREGYGHGTAIPIPWDPVYQKHFSRLIRKLGERYASDPHLVSVTLTCANFMSSEMHLPKTGQDVETWKTFGLTGAKLLSVYNQYTDEWAAAFPGQYLCLHMSPSTSLPDLSADELAAAISAYAIERHPGKFALQRNTLMGRREMDARPGDPMFKYKDRLLVGYQSVSAFLHPERQGTIEMSALNFVHADAHYWELWHGDGRDTETCKKVAAAIEEARKLGYEKYKQKLIAAGLYRTPEQDTWKGLQAEKRTGKKAKKSARQ
jgi:hypothetical protein